MIAQLFAPEGEGGQRWVTKQLGPGCREKVLKRKSREFPDSPVIKTWCFPSRGPGLTSGQGTKILQVVQQAPRQTTPSPHRSPPKQ